ncbi:hypothetical protein pb186bvf_019131 [Paramecium bursaria]
MGSCQCRKFCCQDNNTQPQEISTLHIEKENFADLSIRVRTWQKETISLFDYDNSNLFKEQHFQIQNNGYLIKAGNDIQWYNDEVNKLRQDQILFELKFIKDTYVVINQRNQPKEIEDEKVEQVTKYHPDGKDFQQSENLEQYEGEEFNQHQSEHAKNLSQRTNTKLMDKGPKLWLVIKSQQLLLKNHGVRIKQGDVIKLGRVKFKIIEINLNVRKQLIESQDSSHSSQSDAQICRVCLSTSVSTMNPLVNPCKCSGTMKYIHLECLKKWLRSKLHYRQSDYCTTLLWKHLECELCKFNYPPVFRSDDAFYDLVELSKPTDIPYVLMEIKLKRYDNANEANQDDQVSRCNGVYIISFDKLKELKIGRANEAEINVKDISVSRQHALLKLVDGKIYLQDTKSKFGTLLLLQKSLPLLKQFQGIELQIGRSVIQFNMGNQQQESIDENIFERLIAREDDEDDY